MTTDYHRAAAEDRTLPAVVYALYLVGLSHGLTTVIGLIIAYANRDGAGPMMRSHYTWLIRTFWFSLLGFVLGGIVLALGIPLSLILVGIPLIALGGLIMAAALVYCAVRSVIGVIFLARDEPMPRPYALIA